MLTSTNQPFVVTGCREQRPPPPELSKDAWVAMETIDAARARQWLDDFRFGGQRKLQPNHVALLAQEMRTGRFLPWTSLRVALHDDRAEVLDGQHRLAAVVLTGLPQDFVVVYDPQSNPSDAYAKLDIGKRRGYIDAAGACDAPEIADLSYWERGVGVRAAEPILAGFVGNHRGTLMSRSATSRLKVVVHHAEGLRLFFRALQGATNHQRDRLRVAGVAATALATLRWHPERAFPFWRQLALAEGSLGEPAHTFWRWCDANWPTRQTAPIVPRALAICWNAYFQGRSLRMVRGIDESHPIHLLGTGYTGRVLVPRDMVPTDVYTELGPSATDVRPTA